MQKIVFIFFAVFIFSFGQAQQVFKTTAPSVIGYLEYLPQDYNNNSNKYPVVIFLHGLGERGTNTTDINLLQTCITSVTNIGPPMHVKNGTQFPFILISPQLKNNNGDWPSSYVMEVINHVKTYLRIDERRIYLTGLSLGGGGTWWTAQDYPQQFAAIAPVCGSRNTPSKACLIAAENLPVWAFHGEDDPTVPEYRSRNMVNNINACTPTPSPLAKLTLYAGVAHNAWDRAYAPNNTYHTPNVYDWMMSYSNISNGGNKLPVAAAGADKSCSVGSLTLTGLATDADGTIASYSWKKLSGGAVTLTNANTNTLSIAGLTVGTYVFSMTATDNGGQTDSDYIRVTVTNNISPVANAGVDRVVLPPTNSTTLSGSGTDSDGTVASYLWKFVSGPSTPALTNSSSAVASASNLTVAGSYIFSLTVTDDKGAASTDNVSVRVNAAPISNAGVDKSIQLPITTVTLTGSGSDPDGTIVSYYWGTSVAPVVPVLTNISSTTLTITGLTVAGSYVFKLRVKDNDGAYTYDHVTVIVKAAVTAASFTGNEQVIEIDDNTESEEIDLSNDNGTFWKDKNVIVYNENGATLYSGNWSVEKYQEVCKNTGLYIYRVLRKDARSLTGKFVVMN
jgi:dienelactone hydrolase